MIPVLDLPADLTKRYKMPMYVADTHQGELHEVEVKCERIGNHIRVFQNGFDDKNIYEDYFKWLIYTNVIKVISGEVANDPNEGEGHENDGVES